MDAEKKPRRIRFISGRPDLVDAQVNELLDEYVVGSVNYATTSEGVIVTCYLVHSSELRKMQIANVALPTNQRH